jgi:predicted aldo/keto reductase-like oxidoreductase
MRQPALHSAGADPLDRADRPGHNLQSMDTTRLGRTNLMVSRSGFGAIPIQRIAMEKSDALLTKAYEGGITFFDTAHGYTDSEQKIGHALSRQRKRIVIATKSPARDLKGLLENVATSLSRLKTDYIDILQLHNPATVPVPGDGSGLYEGLLELKKGGTVRFIGITNHRLPVAREAVACGLYDTVQYPFSSLSSDSEIALVHEARAKDVGFIAMKALSGGLIANAASTFAFIRNTGYAVPIWGIETEAQLDTFISLEKNPPAYDDAMRLIVEKDRRELAGSFCRGCGYCLPCSVGIEINMAARLSFLMRRAPFQPFITPEWQAKMALIETCTACGQCSSRCPYELDTPELLKSQLALYKEFLRQRGIAGS